MGRCVLVRLRIRSRPRSSSRPGDGQAQSETALDRLRGQGQADPYQSGRASISKGEGTCLTSGTSTQEGTTLRSGRTAYTTSRSEYSDENIPLHRPIAARSGAQCLGRTRVPGHATRCQRSRRRDRRGYEDVGANLEVPLRPVSRAHRRPRQQRLVAEMLDDRKFFRPIVDKEPAKAPGPFGAAPPRRWTAIGPSTRFFVIRTFIR